MSISRLVAWFALFVSVGLAILGMTVFVLGVVIEFINTRSVPIADTLSPVAQVSLAGLCLSAMMILLGFVLVGGLLARQSKLRGAGYGEAYRLIENFQFPQAIQLLERVLEKGKVTPDALMLLTSAYAYDGQLAKAQTTADRAVEMFPNSAGAYVTRANGYRMQENYGDAALALQTAVQISPDHPMIWAELGFVQQLAGEYDSAIESFKQAALYSMPSMYSVRVNYHLSRYYRKVGDKDNADKATERMIATRHGLQAWLSAQQALEHTTYGIDLESEIRKIEDVIARTIATKESSL
jgi:tetratricopeptide (TPR) repeat protein